MNTFKSKYTGQEIESTFDLFLDETSKPTAKSTIENILDTNNLITTDKTVVGSINEINTTIGDLNAILDTINGDIDILLDTLNGEVI